MKMYLLLSPVGYWCQSSKRFALLFVPVPKVDLNRRIEFFAARGDWGNAICSGQFSLEITTRTATTAKTLAPETNLYLERNDTLRFEAPYLKLSNPWLVINASGVTTPRLP